MRTRMRSLDDKSFWQKITPHILPTVFGIIIGVWCIAYLIFIGWGLLTSVKDIYFFLIDPIGIPKESYDWAFQNYVTAFENLQYIVDGKTYGTLALFKNSIMYCFGNALWSNIGICIVTYVLSKYKHFKWVGILWTLYIISNYVPFNADSGSEIKMMMQLGIFNSMVGNWIYNCGAFGANFLMYLGMWNSIPNTLMEAAEMDGASPWTTFLKVMFPQTVTLMLIMILTKANAMWDDYTPMLLYLRNYPSIASGAFAMQHLTNERVTDLTRIAGLFLLSLPMVVIYFSLKSKIITSMSMAGSVKG